MTLDLNVIRSQHGLAANQAFTLTGGAGVVMNTSGNNYLTSGAIMVDGAYVKVMDWVQDTTSASYRLYDTYSIAISGSAQYLTFLGLSGLNGNDFTQDHVGFNNPQLNYTVPSRRRLMSLSTALIGLLCYACGRRK